MVNNPGTRVLHATSGPQFPTKIQETLEDAWRDHTEVPDLIRMGMSTAAAEVGNNILEHAGHGRDLRVRMELRVIGDQVRLEFTDDGHPAAIDLAKVRMPDPMAESGRGLALARAFCSALSSRRDDDGNHWTLVSQPFDVGARELVESAPVAGLGGGQTPDRTTTRAHRHRAGCPRRSGHRRTVLDDERGVQRHRPPGRDRRR